MYERLLLPRLRATTRSVLLLGPRQVGKSTLLALLKPDFTLNLADPGVHRRYVARPELLLETLDAAPPSTRTVFLDEVQKIPALLDAVQVVLDSKPKRFRFLLSGSSARKIIVCTTDRRARIRDVEVLPIREFLAELPA